VSSLSRIVIKGFKSIQEVDLSLTNFNVLIGENGVGKSNLIAFFKMLHAILEKELQLYVAQKGGIDAFLHYGTQKTATLSAHLYVGSLSYYFNLEATPENKLIFSKESLQCQNNTAISLARKHPESLMPNLLEKNDHKKIAHSIISNIKRCAIYHFDNTSDMANIKRLHAIYDNVKLRHDGGNLAAFLYKLQKTSPEHYKKLCKTIQQVAPFFGDFHLKPSPKNPQTIQLEWTEKDGDYPFTANELSDGTLRFMCLVTLLLQPHIPATMFIDEPELGLPPHAILILASLLREASNRCQLIVSTQSWNLVKTFHAENIIVVEREKGQSVFRRLEENPLKNWLEKYRLF
jgi:predicted ATPase